MSARSLWSITGILVVKSDDLFNIVFGLQCHQRFSASQTALSNARSRVWLVLPLLDERRLEAELGVSDYERTTQFGRAESIVLRDSGRTVR